MLLLMVSAKGLASLCRFSGAIIIVVEAQPSDKLAGSHADGRDTAYPVRLAPTRKGKEEKTRQMHGKEPTQRRASEVPACSLAESEAEEVNLTSPLQLHRERQANKQPDHPSSTGGFWWLREKCSRRGLPSRRAAALQA